MKVENNYKNATSVYSTNSGKIVQQTTAAAVSSVSTAKKSDRLELSEKAKSYQQIYEKIKNGDYDKPEVLNTVAKKLAQII
jgi:hypothetical protein